MGKKTGKYIISKKNKAIKPIVNIYEWNNETTLHNKIFEGASLEWLELIVKCRSEINYSHNYDIVIGKIVNDNVGETVSYVLQGIMRKEDAVEKLKFEEINNQLAFYTSNALKQLVFINNYEVEN